MANSCSDHTATLALLQGAVPLVSKLPNGGLYIAPEAISTFAPSFTRVTPSAPCEKHSKALVSAQNSDDQHSIALDSTSYADAEVDKTETRELKASFYKTGRILSSMKRRLLRENEYEQYDAVKDIEMITGRKPTDILMYIQHANKKSRDRGKAIRRAIVWKWYCQGMQQKPIAEKFGFGLSYKTVASDIKKMKSRQNGVTQNVR